MDTQLPITILSFAAALLPILTLLVLLVGLRWSTSAAAPVALAVAAIVAFILFQTSLRTLAVAAGKGIWDAIFILYVVWPALILYQTADGAGAFDAIQRGVRRLIPDRLLVVLVFAWVLTPFIQAIAGFGTPLAVVSPILLGLGVKPLYAVLLPIIGGAWANSFGSLGAPWFALTAAVDVPDPDTALRFGALLVWIPELVAGFTIAWLYGRGWALKRAAPAIIVISLLRGVLLVFLLPLVLPVAMFLSCAAGLAAAILLSRWSFYRQEDDQEPDRIFAEKKPTEDQSEEPGGREPMPLWVAFAPYAFLGVVATIALAVPPIRSALETISVGLPFPGTETGYGVVQEPVDAYAAFTPLTHPGTFLLASAVVGYLLYSARDRYPKGTTVTKVFRRAATDALPVTTAVAALLLTSKVMGHSGETTVLALGVANVAGSLVYLGAANFIGILGSLVTSSNTASNVLFGPLQATAAEAEGVSVPLAIGAQVAGAATGNAIAPSDALLGATAVGAPSLVGSVLRLAIPWTVAVGILISIATVALALATGGATAPNGGGG
jgi:lactate permease